jgi:hypothetical protein
MIKPPRCPSLNPDGIWCTFLEGHDGDHQGIETRYRWSEAYLIRKAWHDRLKAGIVSPNEARRRLTGE